MALHRLSGTVSAAPPFDFAKSMDYLRWFPPMLGEQGISDESFCKAARVSGRTLLFSVRDGAIERNPSVAYEIRSERPLVAGPLLEHAVEWLRFFLGLDDDLTGFYALAKDDPPFAPIVAQLYGYHPVKFPSPFEAAAWTILSQRNRMATARNMHRGLMHRFGHRIKVDDETYWAFPDADQVAGLNEGDIALVTRNLRRSEYLLDVARAFAVMPPAYLKAAPYAEAEDWLRGGYQGHRAVVIQVHPAARVGTHRSHTVG